MNDDRTPDTSSRMLGWYPAGWRARYGDEFSAMLDDTLEGRHPSIRFRLSIARAGLREHGHESGLLGEMASPETQMRSGALAVLCAWIAFVLAGCSFAKLSEHFRSALRPGSSAVPDLAYGIVVLIGALGTLIVGAGIAFVIPAFRRFLRNGGWASVRVPVWRAMAATVATALAFVGTGLLARTLTVNQRNGGLIAHPVVWYYLIVFLGTVGFFATMLVLWAVAAVTVTRRLNLTPRVLRAESILAAALAVAMPVMVAGVAVWWGFVGSSAPWYFRGTKLAAPVSGFPPQMVGTMILMLVGTGVAIFGVERMAGARRALSVALLPKTHP